MGAVCGKTKMAEEPKSRQAALEVTDAPEAEAKPQPTEPEAKPPPAKEFETGEGDGVYLLLATENNNVCLVQQYAHSKPEVADGDSLLLQIKPPVYVEIKESRFVLQNGKRTLKMGIPVGHLANALLYLTLICTAAVAAL